MHPGVEVSAVPGWIIGGFFMAEKTVKKTSAKKPAVKATGSSKTESVKKQNRKKSSEARAAFRGFWVYGFLCNHVLRLDFRVLLLFHFGYQKTFYDQKRETDDTGVWLPRHKKNCDREY